MIGIDAVGVHIPAPTSNNLERLEEFGVTRDFVLNKTGMVKVSRIGPDQQASDLCVAAFADLHAKRAVDSGEIDCCVVCTQNPDGFGLPHTAAVVHDKLKLPSRCAAFDVSLGCSGYVYGLSIVRSFMEANGMRRGLFFTADPYSKVVAPDDKDTALLFGDAGAVTLLSDTPRWALGRFHFGTDGSQREAIHVDATRRLRMNGRAVFTFSATKIPPMIREVVADNDLTLDAVDLFILHQGSNYIVTTIRSRLNLDEGRAPFGAQSTGNTVSSSLPLMLAQVPEGVRTIVLAGFGVGLSWAGTVLRRIDAKTAT